MATSSQAAWPHDLPYRALVHVGDSPHGTSLYAVAGSDSPPRKASKALREALGKYGGQCFYCKTRGSGDELHIDHVDARANGGTDLLLNLVVACPTCNRDKGCRVIDAYKPDAARAWLLGVRAMIEARLGLMQD
jgi:5-methylcytosine-specific restriction endonuclease McrA